ncbi:F-box and FNIP repeat-containing protein, partial [Bandra megavirus]
MSHILPFEIWIMIASYLNTNDLLNLFFVNKFTRDLKNYVYLDKQFEYIDVKHLLDIYKFKNINYCYYGLYNIPNKVTHLEFDFHFNKSIEKRIPNGIINMKFNFDFNQPIVNCIPDSVKYLEFGYDFNQPIENSIPNKITHLIFG